MKGPRPSFVWIDALRIKNAFLSFPLAVVIPILDQERDKAIAVLLVSPCIQGHTALFQELN